MFQISRNRPKHWLSTLNRGYMRAVVWTYQSTHPQFGFDNLYLFDDFIWSFFSQWQWQWYRARNAQDNFLLNDEDPQVTAERSRRLEKRTKKAEGSGSVSASDKWREQHSSLAEHIGVKWPLTPSDLLPRSDWYRTLPEREQQAPPHFADQMACTACCKL